MKLKYPLFLKDKLVDWVNYSPPYNSLDTLMKSRIVDTSIRLWLFISIVQSRNAEHNFEIRHRIERTKGDPYNYLTPISAKLLDKRFRISTRKINLRYNDFIQILKDTGTIRTYEGYKMGKDSKKYGVLFDAVKSGYGEIVYVEDRKTDDTYTHRSKQDWQSIHPEVKNLIETHYKSDIDLISFETELNTMKVFGEIDESIYLQRINQALIFNQRYFYFVRQSKGSGRFYSSLSSLPKTTRKHLKIDGTSVCEIDLKNAQPLFLSYLINHKEFREDCVRGIFWDKLASEMGKNREKVKIQFLKYILYTNKKTKLKTGETIEALEKLYPGLYDQIYSLTGDGFLWDQLQNIESSIFIDELCCLDFPYLTLHDCVVVRNIKRDKDTITKKLKSIFENRGYKTSKLETICN